MNADGKEGLVTEAREGNEEGEVNHEIRQIHEKAREGMKRKAER